MATTLMPSKGSKMTVWSARLLPDAQASNSDRATRSRPQDVYSQNQRPSSSIAQCTEAQGKPFSRVNVAMRPSFKRLSPPSVEIQSAPSRSYQRSLT